MMNHNPNWPYIPDHLHKILVIGGSESGKINRLLNLIKNQPTNIEKSYLLVKDSVKSKYQ